MRTSDFYYELPQELIAQDPPVSYTHLRAHETGRNLVCRLLLEKKKKKKHTAKKRTRCLEKVKKAKHELEVS